MKPLPKTFQIVLLCAALLILVAVTVILWPAGSPQPAVEPSVAAQPASHPTVPAALGGGGGSSVATSGRSRADEPAKDWRPEVRDDPTPAPAAEPAPDPLTPMALVEPGADDGFSPDQLDVLHNMRQDFADAVAGIGIDPRDPAYYSRWKELQKQFDERFRAQFGDQAFNQFQDFVLHAPQQ